MNIALLTLGFPFGKGETFLGSEIDRLIADPRISARLLPVRGSGDLASASLMTPAIEASLIHRLDRRKTAVELASPEG